MKIFVSFVSVSSNLGLVGAADRIAYPTSKAAIINFTTCMALDYAKYNIRVNAIAPKAIKTEMTLEFFKKQESEEFEKQNRALHPLNRFAEPEEIAKAILFLAVMILLMLQVQYFQLTAGIHVENKT